MNKQAFVEGYVEVVKEAAMGGALRGGKHGALAGGLAGLGIGMMAGAPVGLMSEYLRGDPRDTAYLSTMGRGMLAGGLGLGAMGAGVGGLGGAAMGHLTEELTTPIDRSVSAYQSVLGDLDERLNRVGKAGGGALGQLRDLAAEGGEGTLEKLRIGLGLPAATAEQLRATARGAAQDLRAEARGAAQDVNQQFTLPNRGSVPAPMRAVKPVDPNSSQTWDF
jgi:hypothetical protein